MVVGERFFTLVVAEAASSLHHARHCHRKDAYRSILWSTQLGRVTHSLPRKSTPVQVRQTGSGNQQCGNYTGSKRYQEDRMTDAGLQHDSSVQSIVYRPTPRSPAPLHMSNESSALPVGTPGGVRLRRSTA